MPLKKCFPKNEICNIILIKLFGSGMSDKSLKGESNAKTT